MRISEVRYEKVALTSVKFETERFTATVTLEEYESPEAAMSKARQFVEQQIQRSRASVPTFTSAPEKRRSVPVRELDYDNDGWERGNR